MPNRPPIAQDFLIDKLTNSIQNVISGDSFATEISLVTIADLRPVAKKTGWDFDWKWENKQPERDVYKLTIVTSPLVLRA